MSLNVMKKAKVVNQRLVPEKLHHKQPLIFDGVIKVLDLIFKMIGVLVVCLTANTVKDNINYQKDIDIKRFAQERKIQAVLEVKKE